MSLTMVAASILIGIVSEQARPHTAPSKSGVESPDELRLQLGNTPGHFENPTDPYMPPPARPPIAGEPGQAQVVFGPYVSVQVNVDELGQNIPGDAANEPSIAIDPTDPNKIVIGWRQFDTVQSSFRQAGLGYSHDGGLTWTFPGVLDPGEFRSDPVLDSDSQGNFYYYSIECPFPGCGSVFKSTDGGLSWEAAVSAFGSDKPWMSIDKTGGIGDGNIYATWTGNPQFTRSTDGGLTFMDPIGAPFQWGTHSIGPDGELYTSILGGGGGFAVGKSLTARDPEANVDFEPTVSVDLGGQSPLFSAPNPSGLIGQPWIATDHSSGPSSGNAYLLCSVEPSIGDDPLDVHIARSTDGGFTWDEAVRVNDDEPGSAWQWFGTMSVAPNGRIDVIWNDTRNTGLDNLSELYYAYSPDAGSTWSTNVRVGPIFNSHVGWPSGQQKLGDYYHMRSDDTGANLAYAATYNDEQDVY
ncbi:MAG: exo-alpha-sialidase, partial [Planctomycetes bacterium]|nr:exo-alpha-sialidase [Planctomycetota bacterium]